MPQMIMENTTEPFDIFKSLNKHLGIKEELPIKPLADTEYEDSLDTPIEEVLGLVPDYSGNKASDITIKELIEFGLITKEHAEAILTECSKIKSQALHTAKSIDHKEVVEFRRLLRNANGSNVVSIIGTKISKSHNCSLQVGNFIAARFCESGF